MKEELITYNTAKLAKEKGFNYPYIFPEQVGVLSCYSGIGNLGTSLMNNAIYNIQAPTQSLLQRWLREEHKIEVSISWEQNMNWFYSIMWLWGTNAMITLELDDINNTKSGYKTYEEALEQGLIEALKLIEI